MYTIALDPKIFEFETEEKASSDDPWFRAEVRAAIDCPHPVIPHYEVGRKIEERARQVQQRKIA